MVKKILLSFKVKIYCFIQWLKEWKFYLNPKFLLFDLSFSFIYLFLNPYRISRKFLEKKFDQKIYDYGETPLLEMEKIVKILNLKKNATILELGSGRGKTSFWLNFFCKYNIIAIEQIPIFVNISNFFIKLFKVKKLKFLCLDMFEYEIKDIDVIYLYGTTLSDDKIQLLINKFKKLPSYVKIITISYALDEYDKSFVCLKSFDISFAWGKTKAYLNMKRG
ncbi:MAG: hypothetical protein KR126chlam6_00089 [Candidatus Anoxychlamydiales bacterium]|nr:hypothetical protein [Candidatus Anoxychlamydiales bacterium]